MGDVRRRAPSPGAALSSPQIRAQSFLFWGKRCPLKGAARPSHTVPASSTAPSSLHLPPVTACTALKAPCARRRGGRAEIISDSFLIIIILFFFGLNANFTCCFLSPHASPRGMTTVDIKKMVAGTDSLLSRRASPRVHASRPVRTVPIKRSTKPHPSVSFFKPCLLLQA